MSAVDSQVVNFEYGFALRGDRQVERGLDSIMERFLRTGSVAEASALAVEKFGRIFEVGLPVALGAAALGMAIEGLYNVGEEAIKTNEKIAKLTSTPIEDLDVSGIESNLSQIGDELEDIGTEHGKKYGESFVDAVEVGFQKTRYNAGAFLANNVLGGADFLNGISFLGGQGTPWNSNTPGFDNATGNVKKLSNRAREGLSATETKNETTLARLQRQEQVSAALGNIDQTTPKGKGLANELNLGIADQNVSEDKSASRKAFAAYSKFQDSISDGHDLTQQEIQTGIQLEKKLNEARTKLVEDTIAQDEDQTKIADEMREQSKFHKGEVVASSGRRVGGGGGIYDSKITGLHPALSGLGGNSLSAGPSFQDRAPTLLKATDALKEFTDHVKGATDSLKTVGLGSFATPTL